MHSLHFIRLKAKNREDAYTIVENHLYDFGNENNWFKIIGSITPNNKVHIKEPKDHFIAFAGTLTIEKINNKVNEWLAHDQDNIDAFELVKTNPTKATYSDWRRVMAYADLEAYRSVCGDSFNIVEDILFDGRYYDNGVTQLCDTDGDNVFIIFIDMHS